MSGYSLPSDTKLTDFTELELKIADALGVRNKLPVDKNLFDGGCLCHTYPKDSDRACGNHSKMLGDIRNIKALLASQVAAAVAQETNKARIDSKLQRAIDLSGNEFAMGYDDSGCFWRFYYGSRGAGSMMQGWPQFNSESPEVGEALDEYIAHLTADKEQAA